MILASEHKDIYEDFQPDRDTFYFKLGSGGLISFHGRNYNIKKLLTAEQRESLIRNSAFLRITSNCYVNVDKISSVEKDCIRFIDHSAGSKMVSVPRWKKQSLHQRLSQRKTYEIQ
ncbi:MAG: hypothetical protein K0R57_807 [Paenibacillaceae bacterium]|jgi:hypothetical protein|nr:hypothetical protein [Paenibacillaceae bacterium]